MSQLESRLAIFPIEGTSAASPPESLDSAPLALPGAPGPLHSGDDYRALSEAASDAIITFDANGGILSTNGATESIFGYSRSEILGGHISMFLSEGAEQHAAFAEFVRTGIRTRDWNSISAIGVGRRGIEIPLEISLGEYRDGERYFVAILRDVREREDARNP